MSETNIIDKNKGNNISEIALIFVLYNPSSEELNKIRHFASIYYGYIVDNSDNAVFHAEREGNMSYIFNNGNYGIGYAQNVALKRIMADGTAKYVIFFDQDSNIVDNYPIEITKTYKDLRVIQPKLAFLGPTVVNNTNGIAYQSIFHKDEYISNNLLQRRELISSGSCIEVNVLRTIGMADESLFLDFVDCEWCWRAQSLGFINGITPKINLSHKVGNNDIYIGKYEIIISAPYRYFYQCRNLLWLLRRNYVPTQWKIANGIKLFCRFFYFPFVVKSGLKCSLNMARGFVAGLSTPKKKNTQI